MTTRPLDIKAYLRACPVVGDSEGAPTFQQVESFDPYAKNGPNRVQQLFHCSVAKYRWLCGGLGSGKSTAVAREAFFQAVLRLWEIVHVGLVVSETYRHLADNTLPAFQRAFDPACLRGGSWQTAFSKQEMTLYLANGSTILFRVTGNRRYEMLRGPEFAWCCFDEGRNIPSAEPWKVIVGRLRYPGVPPQLLMAWGGSTPNGLDWQHDIWVRRPTEFHAWFHAKTKDNKRNLPEGYEDTLRSVYAEEDAQQELEGLFVSRSGAVFSELKEQRWPEGNLYPMSLDTAKPAWAQIDFGYRNPRLHVRQRVEVATPTAPRHRIDVITWELQGAKRRPPCDMTIHEVIAELQGLGLRDLRGIFCDPAGDSANDQTHITSVQHLKNAFGSGVPVVYPLLPRQRSIAAGEQTVRGLIRSADAGRRLCWSMDILSGNVSPSVKNSFEAVRSLQYPPREPGKPVDEKSMKDGVNDHDVDAIRYWAVCDYGVGQTMGERQRNEAA